MLSILFLILFISVMGNMIRLSFRMAWGLSRILLRLVFLPVALIFMVLGGLMPLVIGILIVVGIASLVTANC